MQTSVSRGVVFALAACLACDRVIDDAPLEVDDAEGLDPSAYAAWLDPSSLEPKDLLARVELLSADRLEAYTVSPLVNRAGVEDPRCLEPAKPATLW